MIGLRELLLGGFGAMAVVFAVVGWRCGRIHPERRWPTPVEVLIGVVTDFFDTLGIGSFATSTSVFRLTGLVEDQQIPGTLNVGHATAAFSEALIFVASVEVEPTLLASMVLAAGIGAWLGADVVLRLPLRALRLLLGAGLVVAGLLFVAVNLQWLPGGGNALGLDGWRFVVAISVNAVLGALMAAGLGLYGPCMIMLALLGMNPITAFPIMAASGALQQTVSSLRYLRAQRYAFGPTVGLALGGIAGVLAAALFVHRLSPVALRWLVVLVVLYSAFGLLRAGVRR